MGQTAIELYEQGKYRVALERFRAAERTLHSPVFLLYEARCLEKLGRLVEAKRAYEALGAQRLPAEAPPAWRAALSDASAELVALEPRVPSARVTVSGARPVALRVDGVAVAPADAASELWLDPGVHRVEARDDAGRLAEVRFELAEGERNQPVQLTFPAHTSKASPQGIAASAAITRAPTRVVPPPATATSPATDALGITLLSAGAAGLIVGTVTGAMAASSFEEIRDNCVGSQCRKIDRPKGERVEALALVSTIGFAVGGASLGTWGLRLFLTPSSGQRSAFSAPSEVRLGGSF